jgi:hypothetical protein
MLTAVCAAIAAQRHDLTNEEAIQRSIAGALAAAELPFVREAVLAPGSRVDFLVASSIAVEVKLRCSSKAVYRQLLRYAGVPGVTGLVLATAKRIGLPATIAGKPCRVVSLGEAWL